MTHDWTYRPFMECIENVKYTTKLQTKDFAQQGTYPIISQDESYISGYWDNANDVFHAKRPLVIFGDHTRVLKYIDFDFVLGADGVKILLPTEDILAKYMYYYLKWYNVPSLGYSRHFKLLRDIEFPIPSLSEQESIVAELDAINHLIDLQQQQLREYDRLAQSLFYSTFGDPTTNPKGWKVKKLSYVVSEECKMSYGIVQPGDDIEDGVPVVRPIDFKDSEYIQRNGLKRTLPSISDLYKRTILHGDEILICVRGTTGTMGLATPELKGCNVTRGIVPLYFRNEMNKWFMYKYLKSNFAQNIIAENTYGATLKQINISALRNIPVMCPPLALQQTFAAQIEAIEQQKALIRRSLEQTRTLLAARMQYYFE